MRDDRAIVASSIQSRSIMNSLPTGHDPAPSQRELNPLWSIAAAMAFFFAVAAAFLAAG
jgi:hypothetical protein